MLGRSSQERSRRSPLHLRQPDLDADVVQPEALFHECVDLSLILRGQLKDERRQGRKDLPRWKEPVEEFLQVP